MANEANLEKVILENRVENMENTLKELMASFQSLQATLVTRAPLTTNPLFEGNVSVANLPIAISTLGKEQMSSCPPNPTIGGTSGTKPFVLNAEDEDKAIKVKVQLMEETLKSMQGVQTNKPVDISSLCFFPNIQLPHKFKLPEFDKYSGTGCPYAHLTMYCPADAWFSTLDKSKIKSWHDLTHNFMKQYEYNTSLAHNREDLQKIKKKSSESFKEFAQRWRRLAARVQPPLTDHELSNLFIKSTKGPYREKLITCVNYTFAQLVVVGEQVEDGIKSRIIMDYQAMKSLLKQYQNDSSGVSSSKKVGQNQKKENENSTITRLVTPVPMVPLNPPFPIGYNPQARCEYHSREPEVVGLNVTKNPLSTHDGPTVNMIEKDFDKGHEVTTSTNNDGLSTSFEKLSICVIDEAKGDDKLILPTHGEALDNKTVEILSVPIIKS
ncbi:hypothetical protein SLEP1_g23859 [Rubroshorea leprosula]|uniref:Retrotransposon gag domain-containing protein n=1 Tax=Rubroshorea leprosula TaxID=152421 RepID=A0AAV5JQT5_9ROSI|nr:hypothetical protein SLEP1_g23859 [Rubroshorea leprosula]